MNNEDKLTVEKILGEDDLKGIADKIVGGEIDNIILVYRDVKGRCIGWDTTIKDWASVFGEMDMANDLMHQRWVTECDEDEGDEKDGEV